MRAPTHCPRPVVEDLHLQFFEYGASALALAARPPWTAKRVFDDWQTPNASCASRGPGWNHAGEVQAWRRRGKGNHEALLPPLQRARRHHVDQREGRGAGRYFDEAPPHDAAWAVYFLAGGKPRQVVKTASLVCWPAMAGIDRWLFDECYQSVGDLAETIALVLPRGDTRPTSAWPNGWSSAAALRGLPDEEVARRVAGYWDELDAQAVSCW
jgi:hypothetical protein